LAIACLVALAISALVTATTASGATCIFEGGTLTVRAGDDTVVLQQDGVARTILVDGLDCSPAAPLAETSAIFVSGGSAAIRMFDTTGATTDWGAIDWTLRLGFSVPGDLVLDNGGGTGAVDITAGASGIDLNTDGNLDVTYTGVAVLSVIGGPAADTISGSGDATIGAPLPTTVDLSGGAGDDRLAGGLEGDRLDCGLDVDRVDFSASAAAVAVDLANAIATGQGADVVTGCENVTGSPQADTLIGDLGDNRLAPGPGDDTVDGSGGIDTVEYADATAAVVVDLATSTATGGSGDDTLVNLEGVVGSGFDDRITGDAAANTLVGGAGVDLVEGGDGDDRLDGGTEIDRLVGGGGVDTCVLGSVELSCDPSLTLTPTTTDTGGSVDLTGSGWYPENGAVEVRLVPPDGASPQPLTERTPDEAGAIRATFDAPSTGGTYSVEACQPCTPGAEQAAQDLLVQAATGPTAAVEPSLALDPEEAGPGERIQALGSGWDPTAGRVRIFVDPDPATETEPDERARPGPDGSFDVPLDVPELDAGTYTVLACQRCNGAGRTEATATLTIPVPRPWWWFVVALVLVVAVIAGVVLSRINRPPVGDRITTRLDPGEPEVLVVAEPDGSARHTVRLVPRPDPGVQRVGGRSLG
jgi:hypothetical protein